MWWMIAGVDDGRFAFQNENKVPKIIRRHSNIHLENPESQLRWYFKYFLGRGKWELHVSLLQWT